MSMRGRSLYNYDVSLFSTDMFIFRNCVRRYGYSLRGKPPRRHQMMVRGERVSAITCISFAGVLDVKLVKGTTNGDTFYDFIQKHLLPHLMPYNDSNPHSVITH